MNVKTKVRCSGERHVVGLHNGRVYTECDEDRCAQIKWSWDRVVGTGYPRPPECCWDKTLGLSALPKGMKVLAKQAQALRDERRSLIIPSKWSYPSGQPRRWSRSQGWGSKKVRGWKREAWRGTWGRPYRSQRWRVLCEKRVGETIPTRWGVDWRILYSLLREGQSPPKHKGEFILPTTVLRIDSKRRLLIDGDRRCFLLFESGRTRLLEEQP